MLKKDSVIAADGFSSGFEPQVGIRMFYDPVGAVVVLEHEEHFLETRHLGVTTGGARLAVEVDRLVNKEWIEFDLKLLAVVDTVVLESVIKVGSR